VPRDSQIGRVFGARDRFGCRLGAGAGEKRFPGAAASFAVARIASVSFEKAERIRP